MRSFAYYINRYRIIDGDTIEANLDLGFHLSWDFNVRLAGIDAPENKTATRRFSECVAAVVKRWIDEGGTDVRIQSLSVDEKYGRLLGAVVDRDNNSLNQFLITHKLVFTYDGKTKRPWTKLDLDGVAESARQLLGQSVLPRS